MAAAEHSSVVSQGSSLPGSVGYTVKRRLLGPPLVNEQLPAQRLSRPLALGVLSCDGISSAAYGSEEILRALLPFFGLVAFTLVLPMTLVILFGIALVVLSYREVVSVYTKAGGSYVVARENFGPRVAQVAAAALLIDYVVTVAVQTAAGSAAIVSAFPALDRVPHMLLIISIAAIGIMCYGNLRGIREAGRWFALPTYLFSGSVIAMIIAGLAREVAGGLPHVPLGPGTVTEAAGSHAGLIAFGAIYILARAFANGGSSLTGIEAVSNAVSALRPPEAPNARQVLITQGAIVAVLIGGISWLAHVTHATPYTRGVPTVLAQEASLVFGPTVPGRAMFFLLQAGTAAILFTGGNTSFSGFPFLASFVAEDSFLPHWLTKRGHRLAFSSGIIVLTVGSLALLIAVGAQVDGLIPFYAIGVFAGFTLAGFGMARYHRRTREPGWRRRLTINAAGGVYTAAVVVLFTIVKFTEGAWLVIVLFPVLVFTLIRLNRQYRMEAEVLEDLGDGTLPGPPPNYGRRSVIVLIDRLDLAALAALRYANSLRPTKFRAVHFVLDGARADRLREAWVRARLDVPLDLVDCADRRLAQAAAELAAAEAGRDDTHVTVVLPRRGYSLLARRLLHDHTADKIAHAVSRIPDSAATIIPFDVQHAVNALGRGKPHSPRLHLAAPLADAAVQAHDRPAVPPGAVPIGSLTQADRSTVEGRVHSVEIRSVGQSCVLACTVADATGQLTALFYGRRHIPGVEPGIMIRLHGTAGHDKGTTMMVNPSYELVCQVA